MKERELLLASDSNQSTCTSAVSMWSITACKKRSTKLPGFVPVAEL